MHMNISAARELLGVGESASKEEICSASGKINDQALKAKDPILYHRSLEAEAELLLDCGWFHNRESANEYVRDMDRWYKDRIENATWLDNLRSAIGSLIEKFTRKSNR